MTPRAFPCTLALSAVLVALGGCASQPGGVQVASASVADEIRRASTIEDCTRIIAMHPSSRMGGHQVYPECIHLPGGVQ